MSEKAKTYAAKPFTRMLPAWLRWDEQTQTHVVIPERATVLQSIFEKADAGWGQHRIAGWLNEQSCRDFSSLRQDGTYRVAVMFSDQGARAWAQLALD